MGSSFLYLTVFRQAWLVFPYVCKTPINYRYPFVFLSVQSFITLIEFNRIGMLMKLFCQLPALVFV